MFITPEYDHSFPAVLKNALDYLYAEWNDKAAGFVGLGGGGGLRAVEQLRLVLAELKVATVRTQVVLGRGALQEGCSSTRSSTRCSTNWLRGHRR